MTECSPCLLWGVYFSLILTARKRRVSIGSAIFMHFLRFTSFPHTCVRNYRKLRKKISKVRESISVFWLPLLAGYCYENKYLGRT